MQKDLLPLITKMLSGFSDPERKKLSEWYYPTSMIVIGVSSGDLNRVISFAKKELKGLAPAEQVKFCVTLSNTGVFEHQQTSFGILKRNFKIISKLSYDDIIALSLYMDNWVSTDSFSMQISGPAWRLGILKDEQVCEWAMSPDRWWRRIALASTVGLNLKSQGGSGDTQRTIMICKMLIGDKDDMVVKAMSWALRELSKSDRGAVRDFLNSYESMLPGRVVREVSNKLNTGRKNIK
jgi:3-methyladenine DNA glycosylase AlkD